jgi:hypothetical protein
MLKRTFVLLVILSGALPLSAYEWKPFAGVMGKTEFATEGHNLLGRDWKVNGLETGTQVDVGVRRARDEIYLGFSVARAACDVERSSYGFYAGPRVWWSGAQANSVWRETERIASGYRWWPLDERSPFAPFFGAAAGYGWVKVRREWKSARQEWLLDSLTGHWTPALSAAWDSSSTEHSTADWDGLLEAGVAIRVIEHAQLLALGQVHTHFTRLPVSEPSNHGWTRSGLFTFALQLRYTFG